MNAPSPRCAASSTRPSAIGMSVSASGTRSPDGAAARRAPADVPPAPGRTRRASRPRVAEQDDAAEAARPEPRHARGDVDEEALVQRVRVVVQVARRSAEERVAGVHEMRHEIVAREVDARVHRQERHVRVVARRQIQHARRRRRGVVDRLAAHRRVEVLVLVRQPAHRVRPATAGRPRQATPLRPCGRGCT
jgi:hypothetical protein